MEMRFLFSVYDWKRWKSSSSSKLYSFQLFTSSQHKLGKLSFSKQTGISSSWTFPFPFQSFSSSYLIFILLISFIRDESSSFHPSSEDNRLCNDCCLDGSISLSTICDVFPAIKLMMESVELQRLRLGKGIYNETFNNWHFPPPRESKDRKIWRDERDRILLLVHSLF